jgi:hypothetical protein
MVWDGARRRPAACDHDRHPGLDPAALSFPAVRARYPADRCLPETGVALTFAPTALVRSGVRRRRQRQEGDPIVASKRPITSAPRRFHLILGRLTEPVGGSTIDNLPRSLR